MEAEPPLTDIFSIPLLAVALAFDWGVAFAFILLLFLLICSALISASEVAYFSMSPQDVHDLKIDKTPSNGRIEYLHSIPHKLLATILISNNFVNISIVMVANYISMNVIPQSGLMKWAEVMADWPFISIWPAALIAGAINFIITTVLVTFLLVLFGEVAPKIYAKLNNVRLAQFMSQPLVVLVKVFSPFSALLVSWSKGMETRMKSTTSGSHQADKEEIDKAIDLAVSQGTNSIKESKIEADLLKSIIKFNEVSVKQIMRSRVDVVAVDKDTSYKELIELILSSGYSRIPVYEESFDNILGILYIKDLIQFRNEEKHFDWNRLVRPQILYVPESKKINDLLKEFQQEHVHVGIVVDEYGGSSGLVTLEDVMEQVIGEIKDEFDDTREGDYKKIDSSTYVFDGKTLINDVCRIIDLDSSALDGVRGDADSLAGLILEINGKLPQKGEEFNIQGLRFIVLSVSARRIQKIRLKIATDED